ncbi:MAG: hypothetical protein KAT62_04895 [Desulfuromonadales bacterium]|nr:hypothetical protein [Desulfuromonadales bacterium]
MNFNNNIKSLVLFLISMALLSGCATIDPKPFSEFSLAVQEFRDGADTALSVNNELNRERYIKRIAKQSLQSEGKDDVLNLFIDNVENDPFGWKMKKVPLFMVSKRFQSGVYNLNSSLVEYAELLKSLAAPETVSKEQFDDLARDLDAGLTAAAERLEFKEVGKGIAMFSAAATQAAHAFIDNKRGKSLQKIIDENQGNIATIAEKLQEALRLAAINLRTDYKSKRMNLAPRLTPGSKDNLGSREKIVKQFVELNEEYVTRLEILKVLDNSSQTLPNAHRELALAIKSPKMKLSSISDLSKKGKQLKKLYKELEDN